MTDKISILLQKKLDELSLQPSHGKRIKFAKDNFQSLSGAGSSRHVFDLRDHGMEAVLKVAKNEAGVVQNLTESDHFINNEFSDYLAGVIDYHDEHAWTIANYCAKPISAKQFEKMIESNFSIPFSSFYREILDAGSHREDLRESGLRFFESHDKLNFLYRLAIDTDANLGDLCIHNSWGIRSKDQKFVISDYGLTTETYNFYYKAPAYGRADWKPNLNKRMY